MSYNYSYRESFTHVRLRSWCRGESFLASNGAECGSDKFARRSPAYNRIHGSLIICNCRVCQFIGCLKGWVRTGTLQINSYDTKLVFFRLDAVQQEIIAFAHMPLVSVSAKCILFKDVDRNI